MFSSRGRCHHQGVEFEATLRRWPGPSAWVFAAVPAEAMPSKPGPFGRVPVVATVDGHTWQTSVWRDQAEGWLLPVPARVRRGKDDGDWVVVEVRIDEARL